MKTRLIVFITVLIILVGYAGKQVIAGKISPVEAEQKERKLTKILTIKQLNSLDYGCYIFESGYYRGVILKYSDGHGTQYSIGYGG